MPILDNELPNILPESNTPNPYLGSPAPHRADIQLDTTTGNPPNSEDLQYKGASVEQLKDATPIYKQSTFSSPTEILTAKELSDNQRYPVYKRGLDLENIYGEQQSWYSKLGNGVVKMAATGVGTFAQSFATIPNTISAIKNGKTSNLYGGTDGYEGSIDNWLKNIENKFPNYYTIEEQKHPFLSAIPFTSGSANFWGDKFIKNLGFTVGAIGGAIVQDAAIGAVTGGLGEIPGIASQVGKVSLWLNKLFIGTNDVEKVLQIGQSLGKTGEQLLNVKKLGELAAATKVENGIRYGVGIYGSARTEGGVEARDGYRQVKTELVKQYKLDHLNEDPTGQDLQEIEDYSTNSSNIRFGINMVLLSVSDAIQFDNLFRTFEKTTSRGITGGLTKQIQEAGKIGLKEGSIDEFEKKATKGVIGNVWNSVKPMLPVMFTEGVYEEGGQYAAERGTYDYYTRKYKNSKNPNNVQNWDTLNETLKSTGYGMAEQFGTSSGWENMFLGALTGMFSGAVSNKIDAIKGKGSEARLQYTLSSLNQYGLTGTLNNKYEDTLNTIGIAKEMDDAVKSGDIFKYKNLKNDMFFNYVTSRIPSGMHDVTIEQLEMLKDLPKEDFEKTFGMDFNQSSKQTVNEYVNALVEKANNIKQTVDALDDTFKNPFQPDVNIDTPEKTIELQNYNTFNQWKKELAYYASVGPDINSRLESINKDLFKISPLLNTEILSKINNKESLEELSKSYEEKANQISSLINEFTSFQDKKNLKNQVKSLRTFSERISLATNSGQLDNKTFNSVLNFELNNQDSSKDNIISPEQINKLAEYSTDINRLNSLKKRTSEIFDNISEQKGFEKYFEQADKITSETPEDIINKSTEEVVPITHEFINKTGEKESLEVNREYELANSKLAKVVKLADDRWKVISPDGSTSFFSTKDEAKQVVDELNSDAKDLTKIKVLSLNPDGTVKVEDLSGNIQNISTDKLTGYVRIQTEQEKLLKNKEDLDKEQENLEHNSGDINTGDPTKEEDFSEEKKKSIDIYFQSSVSESEDLHDPTESTPHIKRSREFLNNAKKFKNRNSLGSILVTINNEESLGLKGLTQLSYGIDSIENANNIDTGFVAQVYITQEENKTYFVDKEGNKLTEVGTQIDLNNVVFQTMPTTETQYTGVDKSGKSYVINRYREEEKDEFFALLNFWKTKREELFNSSKGSYKIYKFNISRGIPIESIINNKSEKNHVGGILIDENKIATQQGLIQISIDGNINHQGQNLKFSKGRTVLQYGDTLQFLNNSLLTDKALTIYQVIKVLAKDIQKQSDANEKVYLNIGYSTYLQNVLFWKKEKTSAPNQIFIDTSLMNISLGDKSYGITEIESKEEEIISQLSSAYHSINNSSLNNKNFNNPFIEYVFDNGTLSTREWTNYQSYLLSAKNTNGSNRSVEEIPLYTTVAKPTESLPYSFKQKYSTLIDFELPIQNIPVQESPKNISTDTPILGEFVMDGETKNTFKGFKSGPIEFTAKIDENNNINVELISNPTFNKLVKDENLINNTIVPFFKKVNLFNIEDSNIQLVTDFVIYKLKSELETLRKTPIVQKEETLVPKQEVNDIEAKKADIEKRRQEELIKSSLLKDKEFQEENKKGRGSIEYIQKFENRNKEINTKYDKELSKLENKPTNDQIDINKTDTPDDQYRKIGKQDNKQRMTDAEIELFEQWHQENVSNIPFEVLNNIISINNNEKAWGVFENNTIKFYKGALKGTEYHEAFEGIWKSFLSNEEKQLILDEFKTKEGSFTDRQSNKQIRYSDSTNLQAKERIADDFSEYRLGKISKKSLGERILSFFKNIIEWFKSFGNNPSLKMKLFKAIDAGRFKEYIPNTNSYSPEYRKIEGIDETLAYEYVQDMFVRSAQFVFGEDKKALYDVEQITGEQIYNKIKEAYIKENKYQELGEERFNQLFKRNKELLRTVGINFNEEDRVDINEGETNNRTYSPEPFTTDAKKSSPFAIKFICATLPITEATNQQNSSSLVLPQRIFSRAKGYITNNFSRIFATLLDKLSNTSNVNKVSDKLLDLAKYDANYVRFFQRVGGDLATGTVPFNNFKAEDWRLFIEFFQTFTKQRPDALIQYITGDEVYTGSADIYSASRELKTQWFENIKTKSKDSKSIITRNSLVYQIKKLEAVITKINEHKWKVTNYLKELTYYDTENKAKIAAEKLSFPVKTSKDMINFLNEIGISISMEDYLRMKDFQKTQFGKTVSSIRTYLQENSTIGSVTGRTLGINQQLNTLSNLIVKITNPNQENTLINVEGTRSQTYTDNNVASIFENEFNSVDNLEELIRLRPELNDIFSKNSTILKKGGEFFDKDGNKIKDFKIAYIQGTKNIDNNKGISITKLSLGDRGTQEINQNLNGQYYILIPGDSKTEWMMNLGNSISFTDIQGNVWPKIYKVFRGYLSDDISLALDYKNRETLKNIGNKAKELRFFKDILSEKVLKEINTLITNNSTQEQIEEYINKNTGDINSSIKDFINNTINETKNELIKNNQLYYNKDNTFNYKNFDSTFSNENRINKINKKSLSEEDVNNILTFVNVNYIINNIEFHKILFGDPYQFAIKNNKLEETKRIKSFLSPRRTMFDTPEFNTFLNQEYNRIGNVELSSTDPGYHTYKSYANTISLKDVVLSSSLYSNFKEGDSASFIMDATYKEVELKNRQWSEEAENWHQWQMAYTRQNMPGYTYISNTLKEHDISLVSTPEPIYITEVLKPIVSGVKSGENNINLVLDKFSQMPVYFKMAKERNLEKFYIKMWKENADYSVFGSGRKVGVEELHSLYNNDGTFNDNPFNNNVIVKVPWKVYGIQLETAHEETNDQTRGSQSVKVVTMDIFNNGEATSPAAQKEYDRYIDILDKLHQNAYNTLLKKFGAEESVNGFVLVSPEIISKTLENELLRRQLSENAKDTIQLDKQTNQFLIPFEASPSYQQIKDIIYSMINKSLVSPNMNGGPKVMAPVTLWENASKGRGIAIKTDEGYKKLSIEEYNKLSEEEKKNVILTSDTLKFYTKEDPYCEVMLPHWFRKSFNEKRFPTDESIMKYLNTPEGQSILTGIGFRIPTQAMSSMEVFRVKGFLDQSMGDTIIVPSEIVGKTNADFDIDKLNTYLKSVYTDENGDVHLVKYKGSEEATKEFFDNIYSNTIHNQIETLENKDDNRELLLDVLTKMEDHPEISITSTKSYLSKEEYVYYSDHLDMIYEIIGQAEDEEILPSEYINNQFTKAGERKSELFIKLLDENLREEYVNRMYKKSLENEYYDSMEKLITLPENYEHLVSAVDDAGLSKVADQLDKLRGENENTVKNKLLNRTYMNSLRHAFIASKNWVGITAVNITGHSVFQKAKIYIDTTKINSLSKADKLILGDGNIVLPHNTIEKDGNTYTSMSATKTADGKEFISHRLSGYATAIVDAINDPYITKIIPSDLVVGTFMFLERIGVGSNTPIFLNQPIINEYLSYLDSINYKYLYKKSNIDYINNKFPATVKQIENAQIDINYLSNNISNYSEGKSSIEDNAVQQKILKEFLKYSKMAEFSFKLSQATNYDTTKFRNSDAFSRKKTKTEIARDTNILSSIDDLLSKNFIGEQKRLLDLAMSSVGALIKLEQDQFRIITSDVLRPFEEREYMSQDDFDTVASKVKASFLDYIIQTSSSLNSRIQELLVSDQSVANQLIEVRNKYPSLKILNDLTVVSSNRLDGAKTIKLKVNLKEVYDENVYIGMMRELKDIAPELYSNLINLAILQGSYQSAISIKNIIPIEDYAKIIKPIIDKLVSTPDIQAFSQGMFQRNNYEDEIIMPTFTPKFFETQTYMGPNETEITQYVSPNFPHIPQFGQAIDRKILILSPIYNPLEIKSDFIKIPRNVSLEGENVDLSTGRTIPKSEFIKRKNNGDLSLKDIYGYQKVKYSNGEPLINNKGEHVYKLINLWGDGKYASEYYTEFRPSVLDNGTIKTQEIDDGDLIQYFSPMEKETIINNELPPELKQSIENNNLSTKDFKC